MYKAKKTMALGRNNVSCNCTHFCLLTKSSSSCSRRWKVRVRPGCDGWGGGHSVWMNNLDFHSDGNFFPLLCYFCVFHKIFHLVVIIQLVNLLLDICNYDWFTTENIHLSKFSNLLFYLHIEKFNYCWKGFRKNKNKAVLGIRSFTKAVGWEVVNCTMETR